MQKVLSLLSIVYIISLFFMTSCSSSSNAKAAKNNFFKKDTLAEIATTATQIAEYIVEIHEDKKGNIWFGTMAKGVARYIPADLRQADEKPLTYFTTDDGLCGNTISSVAEDKAGNIWFGSHTGLCKYDRSSSLPMNEKTITTMWETSGSHEHGEGWMGVRTDRNENIWASNSHNVLQYDGSSFSEFELPIDKEKITDYAITPGSASLKLEDTNGNLWFEIDGYGVLKYDPSVAKTGQNAFTHFTKEDGLCSNNVTSILEDKTGKIWFTCIQSYQPQMTGDGGVCRYDPLASEVKFTKFPKIKGLNNTDAYSVYEDKSGNLWIGAIGVGVYRYDQTKFTLFDKTNRPDLINSFGFQSFLEDRNGALWFGFSGGLFRFDGTRFLNVTQEDLQ